MNTIFLLLKTWKLCEPKAKDFSETTIGMYSAIPSYKICLSAGFNSSSSTKKNRSDTISQENQRGLTKNTYVLKIALSELLPRRDTESPKNESKNCYRSLQSCRDTPNNLNE